MGSDVCVSVAKYSHATGITAENSIPWTHLAANDLFLLLNGKDHDAEDGELTLRVMHGTATLVGATRERATLDSRVLTTYLGEH